jgi:uncharacterized protein (DUF849 family)
VILTPDFAHHDWRPLADAALSDCEVRVVWPDGMTHTCHPLWLFEQTVGVEPLTREGSVDPGELPSSSALVAADVATDGSLELTWEDGTTSLAHPGWLRSIAEGRHLPRAAIGEPVEWTTATMAVLPTFDGSAVLDDDSVFAAWLSSLCIVGVGRLRGAPVIDGFMADLAARIGPIRGSNFGGVFTVESIVDPDSTANTGMALGQHTDLPTRETPPGFQFLHCVENSVLGGQSRMADGMAVVAEIRRRHPDAYESLTTDEWVFANRAVDGDHRWIGPIIDLGRPRSSLTIRAFYPVRLGIRRDACLLAGRSRSPLHDLLSVHARRPGRLRQPSDPARPGRVRSRSGPSPAPGVLHGPRRPVLAPARAPSPNRSTTRLRKVHPLSSVFITCAVTGSGDTVGKSDRVPFTPEAIANDCIAAAKAGAAVAHVHVRDPITGAPSRNLEYYTEVVDRVRSSDVDVVLNLTSGMGGDLTLGSAEAPLPLAEDGTDMVGATERLEHVQKLRPEITTLDCGSMNFGEGDYVMTNTPATLQVMARQITAMGVRPEIEAFDTGHLWQAKSLVEQGCIEDPVMIQLCMGIPWGAPADVNTFMAMVNNIPDSWTFSAFSIGRMQLQYVALAAIAGGNVRVGLEDNLYLGRGELATNAALVERAAQILGGMNIGLKSPADVRAELQLTKHG